VIDYSYGSSYRREGLSPRLMERHAYRDFCQLESMDVTAQHLKGWVSDRWGDLDVYDGLSGVIPNSVKRLILRGCEKMVLEKVNVALNSGWPSESRLEFLTLMCFQECRLRPWVLATMGGWEEICNRAGVKLEIGWQPLA